MLLTRAPLATKEQAPRAAVRLACVKHAASVQSEPGSNSLVQSLFCRSFAGIERGNEFPSFGFPTKCELRKFFLSRSLKHLNQPVFTLIGFVESNF